jgi:hypothetical protein
MMIEIGHLLELNLRFNFALIYTSIEFSAFHFLIASIDLKTLFSYATILITR